MLSRYSWSTWSRLAPLAGVVAACCLLVACSSGAPTGPDTAGTTPPAEGPRYLRFSLVTEAQVPGESRTTTTSTDGWIDLESPRVRATVHDRRSRVRTELLLDADTYKRFTVDRHGHGTAEETDGEGIGVPYSLLAARYAEAREASTNAQPIRVVFRDPRAAATYTADVAAVAKGDVPTSAFAFEFPEKMWPLVTRRLDTTAALAFDAHPIYWLGEDYEGLTRHRYFYRTSQMQGSPNVRFHPDEWPIWSYTQFAKEGIVTSYWANGDDRWYESTEAANGVGYRGRDPDLRVSSLAVPDVEAYMRLTGDPGNVKKGLRSALDSTHTVLIPAETYGDAPVRGWAAKRFGDTLVLVEGSPDLAARAIEDVVPLER